ncbi:hypothetical protein [Arthrobacter nitrophenolicus]|uniref:hypothetical protein n=1 Tax=Arthrobacter nitrophenolicus TaxID=683150 RepID=UPI00140444DF|nr:hypothetical protein [Arthrobacter nitrophenolicus]
MSEFDELAPVASVRLGQPQRGFGVPPVPLARLEASNDGITFSPVADLPASPWPVR